MMTSTEERHARSQARVANESVFVRWDYLVFALLTALNFAAMGYFLVQWFGRGDLAFHPGSPLLHPLIFLVLTACMGLSLALYQSRWLTLPLMRRPCPMAPRASWRVGVATTFVPGAESLTMLEQTVEALVAMDYPHDVWVLDEGDDPEVKRLCCRLGAEHFSRKPLRRYQTASGTFASRTKHGNYNAWLYEIGFAHYDVIAGFDPDHVPQPNFLKDVLGYFEDPRIGYVQAPQVYYNQPASFIARGAAEETYAYYSSLQMTNYAMGFPIVTGCHNVHRTTALRAVGGFAPHEADDLLITVYYRVAGWKGVYLPKVLARGLTPVDWSGYLGQQRRWARSVLDIKFRVYPQVMARLPWLERISTLLHGLYYLQGVTTALQIVLLAFMLATGIVPHVVSFALLPSFLILFGALELCELYRQRFFLEGTREWGLHWRAALLLFAKWPYFVAALCDAVLARRSPYVITRKVRVGSTRYALAAPHLLVVCVLGGAWIIGLLLHHSTHLMVDLSAAGLIVVSLGVAATSYLRFPDPYDPRLASSAAAAPNSHHSHAYGASATRSLRWCMARVRSRRVGANSAESRGISESTPEAPYPTAGA
jgi:cellulose synthase (UDP-forming)